MLCNKFKKKNVIRQFTTSTYPFQCDFYVKTLDLFIELNGSWTHGSHPFNPNVEADIATVEKWKAKHTKYYDNAIATWTVRDVNKRTIAKQNNLNLREFWTVEELKLFLNS